MTDLAQRAHDWRMALQMDAQIALWNEIGLPDIYWVIPAMRPEDV